MLITTALTISSVSANEITINENSTGGIKEAVNTGNSTIILESGTYKGENNTEIGVRYENNIIIKSKNPNNKAIIDCNNSWFIGNAGNLTLINLIIVNGQGMEEGITQGVITNLGTIYIINCSFMNNNLTIGSVINNIKISDPDGIITVAGSAYIINSTFINNKALEGGAIFNQGNISIANSNFTNNSANTGGAIYNDEGLMEIYSSVFLNNKAIGENGGGAIFNDYCDIPIIIDSCSFINNSAKVGGSIGSSGSLNILRSKFIDNTATSGGGGIASAGGELGYICNIYNSSFINNSAPMGGAVLNIMQLNIFNCNFTNNKANETGEAIINLISPLNVSNSNFNNNSATKGSDIYLSTIQFPVSITYNTFLNSKNNSIYYINTEEMMPGMVGNVSNVKISHNWWGTNNIKDKVIGVKPINYYTMKITTKIANNKLYVTDKLTIYYYFVLNGTNNNADAKNKLKYFTTSLYYNGKLLKNIDGRINTNYSITLKTISNTVKAKLDKQESNIKYTARKLKTTNNFQIASKSKKYTKLKISLKDNKKKSVAKKWIKVYKGKKYLGKAKTNTKGIAYLKIKTNKIKGKNKITTKYTGTGIYTSSKKTKTLKI
ncbi:adhesin-like protein [Methanobrevibacter arboriphilus JCM 13429 = DSM 1125]|uniref:Adhesin-like protein n=2 Tax=Methanobrevibacter arboriphilus TaxID=39441 RepID=A0A1V6N3Y4_METAZ|nr:adhesin-like protein [Methanobrevibacter arboriphilus JCM 13429 = DSM 1125]